MTLSVLSKLGLIVGVVAVLGISLFMVDEVKFLKRTLERGDYSWIEGYVLEAAFTVGASLLTVILSGLLIWGILKKHLVLLATWLSAAFPIAGYLIGREIYNAIRRKSQCLDDYMIMVLLAGTQTIVLYVIIQLYLEIRRERAAVVKYFEPTKQPQTTVKSAECV